MFKASLRMSFLEYIYIYIHKRRMRLRWHFKDNEDSISVDNNENKFRIKSSWQQPKDDPVLENYLSLLEKQVMSVSPEGKNFNNLSPSEQSKKRTRDQRL